jgi:hypothetical protein
MLNLLKPVSGSTARKPLQGAVSDFRDKPLLAIHDGFAGLITSSFSKKLHDFFGGRKSRVFARVPRPPGSPQLIEFKVNVTAAGCSDHCPTRRQMATRSRSICCGSEGQVRFGTLKRRLARQPLISNVGPGTLFRMIVVKLFLAPPFVRGLERVRKVLLQELARNLGPSDRP